MASAVESTPVVSVPTPPFILIPGLPNFRDIGGYPVAPSSSSSATGRIIRRGVVFRSSEPSKVTEAGVIQLQALGITDVYDLRSKQELEKDARDGHGRQAREWEGARRIFAPVFTVDDYSPEAIALRYKNYAHNSSEGFTQAYQDILNSATSPANTAKPYRNILAHLAASNAPPTPVLLHCTAGKDRTGVICALILSLCGVDDEVVAHEYSLTDLGLRSRHVEFLKHLLKEPALRDNPAGARRMIGSRKDNMLATLAKIRENWGSVEQCVQDLGMLSADEIIQLRKNLIIDEAAAASDVSQGTAIDWSAHAQIVAKTQEEADAEAETIAASFAQQPQI
ncbi:tyrosine phosphatase family-domain-containing protein [Xylariales sp. PMI_506]|nr:tyrosine phosphatase family-domain-containing protein [Xylariales sp. PMI_506]